MRKRKQSEASEAVPAPKAWVRVCGHLLISVAWSAECCCGQCDLRDVVLRDEEDEIVVSVETCSMTGVVCGEAAEFLRLCRGPSVNLVQVSRTTRDGCFLRIELHVNTKVAPRRKFDQRRSLAFLERHISCFSVDPNLAGPFSECGVFGCTSCILSERAFSLNHIFKGIRPPPTDAGDKRRGRYMKATSGNQGPSLPHIPALAVVKVLTYLGARDLRMMSCVCLYLRNIVKEFIPGLRLPLFSHQSLAVSWMVKREETSEQEIVNPPHCVMLPTESPHPLYLDAKLGEITYDSGSAPDCSGGLLCDEPGLGKTITMLALVLKRRGIVSPVPNHLVHTDVVASLVRHFFRRLEAAPCEWSTAQTFSIPVKEQYKSTSLLDYHSIISNPMDLRTIRQKAATGQYKHNFIAFQSDMNLIVDNALLYNGDRSHVGGRALRLRQFFQWWVDDQETWLLEAMSGKFGRFPSYSTDEIPLKEFSVTTTDNESVPTKSRRRSRAATPTKEMTANGKRPQWVDPSMGRNVVFLSAATIVVAPASLLRHWEEQLERHVSEPKLRLYRAGPDDFPLAPLLASSYDVILVSNDRVAKEHMSVDSPIYHVRWSRVVVDEGHSIGSSVTLTTRQLALESLQSRSKWVMTGTPTPNTRGSDIPHLQPLLSFIGDVFYGKNRSVWMSAIQQPFEQRQPQGVFRLQKLLSRVMTRNSKENVGTLPKLVFKKQMIQMYRKQAESYNELVSITQRNLLLSEFYDPNHEDSLMCPKNRAAASNCISNIRKNCNVAGLGSFLPDRQQIGEAVDLLRKWDPSFNSEERIVDGLQNGSECEACSYFVVAPIATTCAHLLCLDCASSSKTNCPLCSKAYVLDSKGIPEQLIELQPAYRQEAWVIDECQNRSAKADFLLKRIREDYLTSEWEPTLQRYQSQKRKMIVFSQFLEHIYLISNVLLREKISRVINVKSMNKTQRAKSLRDFECNASISVLVTDASGALGHDFSFVSRIFLMEPLWDSSLEIQIVSRAHRIGAKEMVLVEKFASVDTIEAPILNDRDDMDGASTRNDKEEQEHKRFCSVLMGLRRVPRASQAEPSKEEEEATYTIKTNSDIDYGWAY